MAGSWLRWCARTLLRVLSFGGHDFNVGSDRDQVGNDGVMEAREGSGDLKGRTVQLGFTDLADKAEFRHTLESRLKATWGS